MYLLIVYDVQTSDAKGARRLRKVARLCQNYGQRVQNSVFECCVTPAQRITLEAKLTAEIDCEKDSVRIYTLRENYQQTVKTLGKVTSYDFEGELVI